MSDFIFHTVEAAPDASKPLISAATPDFGYSPNLLTGLTEIPALFEGYITLVGIFDKTNLSDNERQKILITNICLAEQISSRQRIPKTTALSD